MTSEEKLKVISELISAFWKNNIDLAKRSPGLLETAIYLSSMPDDWLELNKDQIADDMKLAHKINSER